MAEAKGQELVDPHANVNSKGETEVELQDRTKRWDQTGTVPSGSRLRVKAEGPDIAASTDGTENLTGMLGSYV